MDNIKTRGDGRKYRVVDTIDVGGGFVGEHVEMIPETEIEIGARMCRAHVFNVDAGIGIGIGGWMLYPNGEIHMGANHGEWRFNSVEEAQAFLDKFIEERTA